MEVDQFSTPTGVLKALKEKGHTEGFLIDKHGMRGYDREGTVVDACGTHANPRTGKCLKGVTMKEGLR